MTVEKFKQTLVKIEEIEPGKYGYYPFHMMAIDKDDKAELHSLIGLNSQQCYAHFKTAVMRGNKTVIMAMDFPAAQDVPNDFVLLIHYDGKQLNFEIMQYDQYGNFVKNEDKEYDLAKAIILNFVAICQILENLERNSFYHNGLGLCDGRALKYKCSINYKR